VPEVIARLKEGAQGRSVLIVDDDIELAQSLGRILSVFCHECLIATDGEAAYELYRSKFQKEEFLTLVITDLELPKMGGLRLIKQIRSLSPRQSILILSAHDEAEYMAEAIRLDVEGYLIKPLSMPKLFENLEKIFTAHTVSVESGSFENDPVTGWKSFAELADRIQRVESIPFTLLRIRVNHLNNIFKFVGEVFANEYLRDLSELLESLIKESGGTFYRIGNDEFALVLEGEKLQQAGVVAMNMISLARYFHTSEKGIVLHSSLSVGIAYGKEHLLLNSKLSLERVEDHIGGGYSIYRHEGSDENSELIKSREILRMIFDALHEENIIPFFAPIRDTRDDTIVAYESVVKIDHNGHYYGSETFRTIALDMGQMGMITRAMIRNTFELTPTLNPSGIVFIPLSALELSDESLLSFIRFRSARDHVDPSMIGFHIIDALKILKNPTLFQHVRALQQSGFNLMISQFGISKCNIPLLLSLRPDFIKFHPDLFDRCHEEETAFVLSKMVEIIRHLGARPIATNLSRRDQLSAIRASYIDLYSGALAGEPLKVHRD
jgi:c-di-GMP phosphodiesterase